MTAPRSWGVSSDREGKPNCLDTTRPHHFLRTGMDGEEVARADIGQDDPLAGASTYLQF